jgi:hypothetical protein
VSDDKQALKSRLRDFVSSCGLEIITKQKPNVLQCPNPNHADGKPSAILYDENIYCPVCGESYDIFEVSGFLQGTDKFPEKIKYVREKLGEPTPQQHSKPKPQSKPKHKLIPITIDKAKEIFTGPKVQELATSKKWGELSDVWYYRDRNGLVEVADIRFEGTKKAVISFFFDGYSFRYSNVPISVFGRDKINTQKEDKVLICEGAKCAVAADSLPGFVGTTWNGGSKKARLANWIFLKDRDVYIYPDDDLQTGKDGKEWPWYRQPGYMAALDIKKQLPGAKIIKPLPEARTIKRSGADIIEALQIVSEDELAEYIINCTPIEREVEKSENPPVLPFKVLGTADDDRAYFIGRSNRMFSYQASSINKSQLQTLAPIDFWREYYGYEGKINWDNAFDNVIDLSLSIDFDLDSVRGRGAWKESDGTRCYHNGVETIGKPSPQRLYLRKTKKDIGLSSAPADKELAKNVSSAISAMSFETPLDCIRLLGWTLIAPFAGALPWRPSILITGESQSGKSTIIEQVVKPLVLPEIFSGGGTTEAGVRQTIDNDATAIVIEEAEADTQKKRKNREDLFSLMRQSTSDDAPRVAKGTVTGKSLKYKMRSMFLFAAISPDIEHSADDNRIFRVNMIVAKNDWAPIRNELRRLVTVDNCKRIRSLTWKKLDEIIRKSEEIAPIIQDMTNKNIRYCYAEAMLQSAYWHIWKGREDIPERELESTFRVLMTMADKEESRDEPDEMLSRILDERVLIESPMRESITVREILIGIKNREFRDGEDFTLLDSRNISYLKNIVNRHGVTLTDADNVAIANNHHEIMKILERGRGYHRQLWRHEKLVEKSAVVKMAGKSRRCVVLKDVLE